MSNHESLARQVAAVGAHRLLPDRSGTATSSIDGLVLVDALRLGQDSTLLVLRDTTGTLHLAPAINDGGQLRRAVAGDGAASALTAVLVDPPADLGRFEVTRLHGRAVSGERAMGVDQTNESVVVGEAAVVKWLHRVSADQHPAPERLALLDAAEFTSMPQPWGFVFWRDESDRRVLLATVDAYLADADNGWTWCVDDVRRLARGELSLDDATTSAARVGSMVAAMHVGFAPAGLRSATPQELQGWHERAVAALEAAVHEVDGTQGEQLARWSPDIRSRLSRWQSLDDVAVLPIHGDLHVGQILRYRTADGGVDYAVTDFDGNPVLAPSERIAAAPPARDVAGYLQSLDHVGRVVVQRTYGVDVTTVDGWIAKAQHAFLDAYRAALSDAGQSDLLQNDLLDPMQVEQECREFLYAVRYDPVWRYVPQAALHALLADDPKEP